MFKALSLPAAVAAAVMLCVSAPSAEAKHKKDHDVDINIYLPGVVLPGIVHRHGRGDCWRHRHSGPLHWHCDSPRHRHRHCHSGFCHYHG